MKNRARKKTYRFRFAAGLAVGVATLAACDNKPPKNINTAPVEQPEPPLVNVAPVSADAGSTGDATAAADTGAATDAAEVAPAEPPPKRVNVRPSPPDEL